MPIVRKGRVAIATAGTAAAAAGTMYYEEIKDVFGGPLRNTPEASSSASATTTVSAEGVTTENEKFSDENCRDCKPENIIYVGGRRDPSGSLKLKEPVCPELPDIPAPVCPEPVCPRPEVDFSCPEFPDISEELKSLKLSCPEPKVVTNCPPAPSCNCPSVDTKSIADIVTDMVKSSITINYKECSWTEMDGKRTSVEVDYTKVTLHTEDGATEIHDKDLADKLRAIIERGLRK